MKNNVEILQPELSEESIRAQQKELAAEKNLSVEEAYQAIDSGKFHGTIFAAELDMLRFLLDEEGI